MLKYNGLTANMEFISVTSETGCLIHVCWRMQSTSENIFKTCLTSEIDSIFNFKPLIFPMVFQILDPACNAWRDVTISCYFHAKKITLFTVMVENNTCERYHFYSMNNTRYFTAENVILWKMYISVKEIYTKK